MRFTAETDKAHMAKQVADWHKVWCGENYVDIHKFAVFGDRVYSWLFVYTIGTEVVLTKDITDEQAGLPEQELKSLAAQHVPTAVTKWQLRHSYEADVAAMRAAKNGD